MVKVKASSIRDYMEVLSTTRIPPNNPGKVMKLKAKSTKITFIEDYF